MADNLLTTAALAFGGPLALAPAMNDQMWQHPATQDNLEALRRRGVTVLAPATGALGTKGEWGTGRLREPAELLAAVEALVPHGAPRPLDGLRVLVTAGGTREPIDTVRYVGNRSSGRMGFALADEAARRGAAVTCVAANVALERNPVVDYVEVETAAQLAAACAQRFESSDVLMMAAAVADYRPSAPQGAKIKKQAGSLSLELERTEDVLAALARQRGPRQLLVGFAAEHGAGALEEARRKLREKGLDAIVLNDISRSDIGFDAAHNEVTIVTADGERPVPRAGKGEVARAILDTVQEMLIRGEYNTRDGAPGTA
jgi:phosphopantothenoylcysteine decarboxylase / phosphopantothenate---cysteine ligase